MRDMERERECPSWRAAIGGRENPFSYMPLTCEAAPMMAQLLGQAAAAKGAGAVADGNTRLTRRGADAKANPLQIGYSDPRVAPRKVTPPSPILRQHRTPLAPPRATPYLRADPAHS